MTSHLLNRGIKAALFFALLASTVFSPRAHADDEARIRPIPIKEWLAASQSKLSPKELDQLISNYLTQAKIKPAPRTTDEQFVRRVYLDLTGNLPYPADITEFVADKQPNKRAKLIDKLLASDEHARHQARFWRSVIASRLLDRRGQLLGNSFENWMTKQLKGDKSWADITRSLLTATGPARYDDTGKAGANFFLGSHVGTDAPVEQAAETSRVFLGIQINCAQCHDHPSDVWKREQFHEMVAFFARLRQRPLRDGRRIVGLEMISVERRFMEYRRPDLKDPQQRIVTHPKTLDGTTPRRFLPDLKRRESLADWVVDKKNPWFAAAFVNRVWGELLGQSFYSVVDDLGPQKDAYLPKVVTRLAAAFRGSDYNIKELYRTILNSETYQRQARLGSSPSEHLLFAASYPARLKADALWDSLERALGRLAFNFQRQGNNRYRARFGLGAQFKQEFKSDPSLRKEDLEGSIPQALWLMNNRQINNRIEAIGRNLLGRILTAYPRNSDALDILYLRALGRKPTVNEKLKCYAFLRKVSNRREAFEDILWVLINSTEFQTRR